eukprot:TRINITY_DN13837_c0_g1_i1.p1 TRINITY_DN13837_c0_g1~~TRINITY_DN13837_c0_g1_i1.p1  ORF type:complete len:313 (-),score=44.09 TRINITY_DN13837_c0_g1_i1:54-992(-)
MYSFQAASSDAEIAILNAPFYGGQSKVGNKDSPSLILSNLKIEEVKSRHFIEVQALPEQLLELLKEAPFMYRVLKNVNLVSGVNRHLAELTHEHSKNKRFVLTIGGDHSLAIGSIAGLLKTYPDLCVVWIDAHADINTVDTTNSGNIHGCPISFLSGMNKERSITPFSWLDDYPTLSLSRIGYIGLRDVEDGEKALLKKHGIKAVFMDEVKAIGIDKAINDVLNHINPSKNRPIHLSFDIDGLDPLYAPSTGTAVENGLSLQDGITICRTLKNTGSLVSMDLVEVNSALGNQHDVKTTFESATALLKSTLGI